MKWKKGRIEDSDGKSIDCWRSSCKRYLFYLNANQGSAVKKGEVDKAKHMWWYEVSVVPENVATHDLRPEDERAIGTAPSKSGAKELALCESEGM